MMTNNTYSRDIVVFDTSVILHDANSIFGFDNHDIIIPLTVLDEVDKFRSLDNGVGRNARSFIRSLKKLIGEDGVLSDGVKRLETGEKLIVRFLEFGELLDVDRVLDLNKNDDRILALCMEVIADAKNVNVSLVTRDISLLAKANALRVSCFDYHIDSQVRDPNQLYTGMAELVVPGNLIDVLHDEGKFSFIDLEPEYVSSFKAHENMGVTLIDESNSSHTSLCLYKKGSFCKLVYSKGMVCNITPQNREQKIALELIMDPDISLITLTGLAGSGKTLLAVAAGIHLAVDKNMYDRLLVSRPIQPLGKDLGYLPGPQPLDAKIRTPSGWTTMGEIKIGDTISAYDGSPSVVLGVFPKGVKSVYKVSTTEGSTECCLDHLWHTTTAEERKRGKSGSVRDTKQIMETIKSTLPGKKLNSHKPRYGSIRPNHFLPRNKPIINDNPKHLLLPSYVLGSILGDGCIGASISISSVDSEIINHISDELKNSGLNCELHHVPNRISYNFSGKYLNNKPAKLVKVQNINSKEVQIYSSVGEASKELNVNSSTIGGRCAGNLTIGGYSYSFLHCKNRWTNEVKNALFKLGLSNKKAWEKFIPEDYLYRSSIEDRISLLQGLMDTDGSVKRKTGEASFTTTSLQLAKDISSLVRSLGGRSIIRSRNRIG
ncbi:MAG: PhoH family protein, partial [Candidatus Peribacteraceae bacterium]|nr:PhoH family protein [Candidatus Peribacteraceae bacterium]